MKTIQISPNLLKDWKTISDEQVDQVKAKVLEFLKQQDPKQITEHTQIRISPNYTENYTLMTVIAFHPIFKSQIAQKINKTMGIDNNTPRTKYLLKVTHPTPNEINQDQNSQYPIITRLEKYEIKEIKGETLGKYFLKQRNENLPIELSYFDPETRTNPNHGKLVYHESGKLAIMPSACPAQPAGASGQKNNSPNSEPIPLEWITKFQGYRTNEIVDLYEWMYLKFTPETLQEGDEEPTKLAHSTFMLHNPPIQVPKLMMEYPDQTDQWYRLINIIADDYYYWDIKFFLINPHIHRILDLNINNHMYAFNCNFHSFWIEQPKEQPPDQENLNPERPKLRGFRYPHSRRGRTKTILYHDQSFDAKYPEILGQHSLDQYCHEFSEEIGERTLVRNLSGAFALANFYGMLQRNLV